MFFGGEPFAAQPAPGSPADWAGWLDERRFEYPPGAGVIVTDDLNPVDRWCAHVNEIWRQGIFRDMTGEVLSR